MTTDDSDFELDSDLAQEGARQAKDLARWVAMTEAIEDRQETVIDGRVVRI